MLAKTFNFSHLSGTHETLIYLFSVQPRIHHDLMFLQPATSCEQNETAKTLPTNNTLTMS
jgi:hypothetical protein